MELSSKDWCHRTNTRRKNLSFIFLNIFEEGTERHDIKKLELFQKNPSALKIDIVNWVLRKQELKLWRLCLMTLSYI